MDMPGQLTVNKTEVDAAITSRHSVRAFLPLVVSRGVVEDILSVAARVPSGMNTQPWNVHVLITCLQAAFTQIHRLIGELLELNAGGSVMCGMELGHADPHAPENRLRTDSEPAQVFTRFVNTLPPGTPCAADGDPT